jgi:hypothetical protein
MQRRKFFDSAKVKIAALLGTTGATIEIIDSIGRVQTVVHIAAMIWAHITAIAPALFASCAVLLLWRVQELRRPRSLLETHVDGLNLMRKIALAKILDMPAGIGDTQLRSHLVHQGFVDDPQLCSFLTGDINLLTRDYTSGAFSIAEPYKAELRRILGRERLPSI